MDKKTILAFILIGLVLVFTQTEFYKSKVLPNRGAVSVDTTAITDTLERQKFTEIQKDTLNAVTETPAASVAEVQPPLAGQSEEKEVLRNVEAEERLSEIEVIGRRYRAMLSNKGGGLISWKLLTYLTADSQYVEMVPWVDHGVPTVGMLIDRDTVLFDEPLYHVETEKPLTQNRVQLDSEGDLFRISYVLPFKDGRRIRKTFTFYPDRYDLEFSVTLEGFSDITTDRSYRIFWDTSLLPTEKPIRDDLGYTKIYAYLGKDLQDFNVKESKKEWEIKQVSGVVNWSSLRTKYFVSAVVPSDRKGRGILYKGKGIDLGPSGRFKYYNFAIIMPIEGTEVQRDGYRIYLGPLEYNELKGLHLGLERLIMSSSGYERLFRPFSIAILVALKAMHKVIPNWGLVIVIFSILIKLVLYPLTHKSYTSMKKMQLIQPLMAELREKYKNDPQRLNKEMMKLYKDYGVNPMGGCLPMLLQMPLLIGLFIVFRSTIELRGASFFWWIRDLSKPDTIFTLPFSIPLYGSTVNVLPIVMGVTMFFQQKSTMQDPRQKAMAYFMPIFFVLLFNSFPSGLNLYYTLFNLLTILQQKMIKTDQLELKPVEKKETRKGRRRK